MIVRDSGKHCGSPKGVLGVGFFGSLKHNAPGSEKPPYPHCPKNRTAKAVITPYKAITYSGRQITRSPLLVPYANPRPGSGSQRAEFMLTCLLWSAGIGYRTLKTLWKNNRRLLDSNKSEEPRRLKQTFSLPAAAQLAKETCHFTGYCKKPLIQQQEYSATRNAHTCAPQCLIDWLARSCRAEEILTPGESVYHSVGCTVFLFKLIKQSGGDQWYSH